MKNGQLAFLDREALQTFMNCTDARLVSMDRRSSCSGASCWTTRSGIMCEIEARRLSGCLPLEREMGRCAMEERMGMQPRD